MTTPVARRHRLPAPLAALAAIVLAGASPAAAQPRRLTLEDALARAREVSAALGVARAGESRADAQIQLARSQRFPQVSFAGSYDRTLASEFSDAFDVVAPPCAPLSVDPSRPIAERVAEIERAAICGALGPAFNFGDLPFGQRNIYRATVSFSQALFTGGRLDAERAQAEIGRRVASLATDAADAALMLDVTRAYFDAALADRLVDIAEAGERQLDAAFQQARLAVDAGRQPEFEALRAEVARDNQRPIVIRRRADRDLAYLRLRLLLELPAGDPIVLDGDLESDALPPPAPFAAALEAVRETGPGERSGVRQAAAVVQIREAGLVAAQAERKPTVSLLSSFGKVGYPSDGFLPGTSDFRTNWTLGASVSMPIFTGFRLKASELAARADLAEAEEQLEQAREAAALDTATAAQDLTAAEAVWRASSSTIQQAARAYEIAELRYREGISTQLELQDSRLALQQAQASRAMAARDLQVARTRLALLPALPLGGR
jgi:outer membrane protein TolC